MDGRLRELAELSRAVRLREYPLRELRLYLQVVIILWILIIFIDYQVFLSNLDR